VTLESGDSTDELETLVSSGLADEESSQAESANIAANKKMVMSRPFGKLRDLGAMKFFIKTSPSTVYLFKYSNGNGIYPPHL
jgi:hypothetical protein